ncbi:complement C1q-like protein 4 [Saccostrea cucullata]|uniref:complement C1q-like protein 4 n=1 Tax=Saccostrea cuccullata TaxID=36930 RepID=UPI002ED5B6ED
MLEQRNEFIRDNQELKNRLTFLKTIWNERKVSSGKTQSLGQKTQCPFYAYYSADFKSLPKGQRFIYDTVITNIGNGYNESTGAFIAPTFSVFAFSWTLHAAGRHLFGESGQYGEMGALLEKNGIIKGSIAADTEMKSNQGTATGFVILNLTAGDEVKILSKYDGQGSMYSNDVYGRTTFSGFVINP